MNEKFIKIIYLDIFPSFSHGIPRSAFIAVANFAVKTVDFMFTFSKTSAFSYFLNDAIRDA